MWKMLLSMEEPPLMKISDPDEIGSNCDPSDGLPVVYTDVNVVPKHEKEGPQQTLADLQDQILALKSKQRFLAAKRREALNKLLDIKGSIRVFCRVRSFLPNDKREIRQTVNTVSEKITIRSTGIKKEFRVDKVFPQEAVQEDVFMEVEPILKSAIDGHNVCIFAYGQTGTGKTFTMEGTKDRPGIVPRAIEELFHHLNPDQSITMSMLEVYMGSLKDLLARKPPSNKTVESASKCLSIHTGCNGSMEIEGLTDVVVTDHREAIRWYTKGKRARATSWTNVNEASSRSHCLTRITIVQSGSAEKGKAVVSRLWLVDLGGSERLLKTGAVGLTLDEGRAINLSLSALGDVIAALKMRRKHIPYRNSKLTQILRNSLGDSSKVLMLVHISPSENDVAETICSLNFANRARAVEPNKELSEDLKRQKEKSVAILENQMKEIEEELDEVRNQITNIEYLVQEKKKLFSVAYWILEDQKGSPRSPLLDNGEVAGSPRTTEKSIHKTNANPLPRFMTSTACSRQRKNATVETIGRVRPPRQIYRSSMDLYGSQSLSYDMSFRLNSHMSKSKSTLSDANKVKTHNSKGLDLKMPVPTPRDRRVCVSHPNLRGVLNLHRRRMSDFT